MKAWIGAIAMYGLLGSGMAFAKGGDGNELLAQCQSYIKLIDGETNYNTIEAGACGGFVQGVSSTIDFYSEALKKNEKYCSPDGVTWSQLVRVVVKYLRDNPKTLNDNKTVLAWRALRDAYPCK